MTSTQCHTATVALPSIRHLLSLSDPSPASIHPKQKRQDFEHSTSMSTSSSGSIPPLQGMDPPPRYGIHRNASDKKASSRNTRSSFSGSKTDPEHTAQFMVSPPLTSRSSTSTSSTRIRTSRHPSSIDLYPTQSAFTIACSQTPLPIPPPPPPQQQQQQQYNHSSLPVYLQRPLCCDEREQPRPTNLSFTTAGKPIVKRRRGRPSAKLSDDSCILEGGWTFLSPTVWSVDNPARGPSSPSLILPPYSAGAPDKIGKDMERTQQQESKKLVLDAGRTDFQTYIGADLNSIQIPMRKRGRKPKRIIQGHSCFVWKDVPIIRSAQATAKARATATANRKAKEARKAPPANPDSLCSESESAPTATGHSPPITRKSSPAREKKAMNFLTPPSSDKPQ